MELCLHSHILSKHGKAVIKDVICKLIKLILMALMAVKVVRNSGLPNRRRLGRCQTYTNRKSISYRANTMPNPTLKIQVRSDRKSIGYQASIKPQSGACTCLLHAATKASIYAACPLL